MGGEDLEPHVGRGDQGKVGRVGEEGPNPIGLSGYLLDFFKRSNCHRRKIAEAAGTFLSCLILDGLFARRSYTIYHVAEGAEREAVLFQEVEAAVLQEYFFGIQAFLAGK